MSNDMTYLMGGEIDRGFFHLTILGDDLDPIEVSALLKKEPTKSYRKGDLSTNGKYYHRTGCWSLESDELNFRAGKKNCEDQFSDWVAAIPGSPEIWATIQEKNHVYVLMALYMETWNREFDIPAKALLELGKRGLSLHIDTYFDPKKEPNQQPDPTRMDGCQAD